MEFNNNKDAILSLAYSNIKNNIPNYIIINPNNEILLINYNFIYLETSIEKIWTWEEASNLVLSAFSEFSPELANIGSRFFKNQCMGKCFL